MSKNKRWRAKYSKKYYFVDGNAKIYNTIDLRTIVDDIYYKSGNYFYTKKQAKAVAKRVKVIMKGDTCKYKRGRYFAVVDMISYDTECGTNFRYPTSSDALEDNDINFCQKCGRPIEV